MKAVEDANRWQTRSLRDLATINYGRSPAAILVEDGLYPVVGTGGSERRGNDYLHEGESIILGRKGTIDRVYFATGRFWTIDTAYYLTDFTESVPRWLYYFLQTIDLRQMNEATGVPSLSRDLLYKIAITTPPKPEQTKIAEILSTVDRAIEQIEALIAKQQRIKTGLMQDLLTRGIDEHGNLRSEQTHKFKDSPLGRMPVEWEVKPLGTIIEIIDCKHYTPAYVEEGIPVIRPRNIQDSGFDLSNLDFVTERDYKLLTDKHEPISGDIVFSRNASFGVPVYVEGMGRFCIGQDVVVMRKKSVNTRFIFFALKSERVVSQIMNASGGSTFGRIDLGAIRDLKVSFPESEDEQMEVTTRLVKCDEPRKIAEQQLEKLRFLKTALMQGLLTGKKRVTALL